MIKSYFIAILSGMALLCQLQAQEKTAEEDVFKLYGFVNAETFFDTRQTISAREGEVLLYPSPVEPDEDGVDLNNRSSFNMLTLHTRVGGTVQGPGMLGASSKGQIESDFLGQGNDLIGHFRLRHAYIELDWGKTQFLIGKYWHPMFVTQCYPAVISWGGGVPINPLSRNPQIRLTRDFNGFSASLSALSQRDFANDGPGGKTSEYLRNSSLPEFQFQTMFNLVPGLTVGGTAGVKTLVPRTETGEGYKTNETIVSFNSNLFLNYTGESTTLKVMGIYGQNMNNLLLPGGYAIGDVFDPEKDHRTYVNTNTGILWLDYELNIQKWGAGVFAGISQNYGADQTVDVPGSFMGMAGNIDQIVRLAPRVFFQNGKTKVAFEFNNTWAGFGDTNDQLKVENTETTSNSRFLLSVFRYF